MKARHSLLLTALFGLIFSMACTFTTKLPTQTPPTVESLPSPVPDRPQSAFIDSRTVSDSSDTSENNPPADISNNSAQADTGMVGGGVQSQSQGSGGGQQTQYQVQYVVQQQALAPVPVSAYYAPTNIYQVPVGCAPRYDWGAYYQIQRGDTLSNIAYRAGVSVQSLAVANCICNPNLIYAGQILRIPNGISYYPPSYPQYPQYPQQPHYPQYPQYPHYPPPQPTYAPPTQAPPPPVVIGSGLSVTPYDSINNNTINLPPDQLITISWPATFPTAADHVDFILTATGYGPSGSIGMDGNLGDGASIIWNSVNGTQGTLQAVAYFQNGYPPQYSDSYYLIAGTP